MNKEKIDIMKSLDLSNVLVRMSISKTEKNSSMQNNIGPDFFKRLRDEGWTYIKTVVDIIHEPILILDRELRVMTANDSFYKLFQVTAKETESNIVYELGNGQWNIPSLRKLLEDILPQNTFFKGFEINHDFPTIGQKIMLLNGRQIHFKKDSASELFPPLILLAMEDITEMMGVAEMLSRHTNEFEIKLNKKTKLLNTRILGLKTKINKLQGRQKTR